MIALLLVVGQFFGCCATVYRPPVDAGPFLKCHHHQGATVCVYRPHR